MASLIKVENQITLQSHMMFLPTPVDDLSEGDVAEAKEKAKNPTKPRDKFNSAHLVASLHFCKRKKRKKVKPRKMKT